MKTLLVVYHSMTGGTEQMARAVLAGAAGEQGVATRLLRATEAGPGDVLAADGYVFATRKTSRRLRG
jgi:flavodoxin